MRIIVGLAAGPEARVMSRRVISVTIIMRPAVINADEDQRLDLSLDLNKGLRYFVNAPVDELILAVVHIEYGVTQGHIFLVAGGEPGNDVTVLRENLRAELMHAHVLSHRALLRINARGRSKKQHS